MEKYSKWRDPGTGIAPLVTPLPTSGADLSPVVKVAFTPFQVVLGAIRFTLVLVGLGLHWLLTEVVLLPLSPVTPLHRPLSNLLTAIDTRLILAVLGFLWIPAETVSLKRTIKLPNIAFAPTKGDLIVANSSSYIDLLYLAFRYNPTFTLPVSKPSTGASKITGYRRVSLLQAVLATGTLPDRSEGGESLDELLRKAPGPVVVFPEATTSNNRGLLKLAELQLPASAKPTPVKAFILAFKYPAPTHLSPTATLPIPGLLAHLWQLASSPAPRTLSVRRLHPAESPKLSSAPRPQEWEAVGEALAGAGRLKRTAIGWEDKGRFLEFRAMGGKGARAK